MGLLEGPTKVAPCIRIDLGNVHSTKDFEDVKILQIVLSFEKQTLRERS